MCAALTEAGVFSTTLSHEYALAAEAFGLSRPQLAALARDSLVHSFAAPSDKARLLERFENEIVALLGRVPCNPANP